MAIQPFADFSSGVWEAWSAGMTWTALLPESEPRYDRESGIRLVPMLLHARPTNLPSIMPKAANRG